MRFVDGALVRVRDLVLDDCLSARIALYQLCAYSKLAALHSQQLAQDCAREVSAPTARLVAQMMNESWTQERCGRVRNLAAYLARSSKSLGALQPECRQAWVEDFVDSTYFLEGSGRTLLECFALFAEATRRGQWPGQGSQDGNSLEDGMELIVEAVAASLFARPGARSPWPQAQSIPRVQLDIDSLGAEVFTLTGRGSQRLWVCASVDGQVRSAVLAVG